MSEKMEFKGTKNWFYEPKNGKGLVCYKKITGYDTLCKIDAWGKSEEEVEANAKLIASAPDLLEVLQMCEEHIQDQSLLRIFVREAIKKALG